MTIDFYNTGLPVDHSSVEWKMTEKLAASDHVSVTVPPLTITENTNFLRVSHVSEDMRDFDYMRVLVKGRGYLCFFAEASFIGRLDPPNYEENWYNINLIFDAFGTARVNGKYLHFENVTATHGFMKQYGAENRHPLSGAAVAVSNVQHARPAGKENDDTVILAAITLKESDASNTRRVMIAEQHCYSMTIDEYTSEFDYLTQQYEKLAKIKNCVYGGGYGTKVPVQSVDAIYIVPWDLVKKWAGDPANYDDVGRDFYDYSPRLYAFKRGYSYAWDGYYNPPAGTLTRWGTPSAYLELPHTQINSAVMWQVHTEPTTGYISASVSCGAQTVDITSGLTVASSVSAVNVRTTTETTSDVATAVQGAMGILTGTVATATGHVGIGVGGIIAGTTSLAGLVARQGQRGAVTNTGKSNISLSEAYYILSFGRYAAGALVRWDVSDGAAEYGGYDYLSTHGWDYPNGAAWEEFKISDYTLGGTYADMEYLPAQFTTGYITPDTDDDSRMPALWARQINEIFRAGTVIHAKWS